MSKNHVKEEHNVAHKTGEIDIEMDATYRQQFIEGMLFWENGKWKKAP